MSQAAYVTKVFFAPDGTTFTEVDGINSVSLSTERDELEVTDFASNAGTRDRIMGLKSYSVSMSGHFRGEASQAAVRTYIDTAAATDQAAIRILWDGTNGVDIPVIGTSYEVSGELEGTVEFSAEFVSAGVIAAVP